MNTTPQRHAPPAPGQGRRPPAPAQRSAQALRLLEQTHALCRSWLELPLQRCLLEGEHKLFGHAWQTPNYLDQQACLSTRRRLQSHRDLLEPRFFGALAQRFARFGTEAEPAAPPSLPSLSSTLSLLDDGENDQRATLEQMSTRSEARHTSLLFELSYRYGVLVGLPPQVGERLPLSAEALSRALLDALRDWTLPAMQRVLLLEAFDHAVVRELASLYETVNQHLADAGLLPHLRAYRVARSGDHEPWGEQAMERRRAQRKSPVYATEVIDLMHGRPLGRLGNLSDTGLLLIGSLVPPGGAVYQVSVELPGPQRPGAAPATIQLGIQEQWQDATIAAAQVWTGFRIISISPADSARLEAWLATAGEHD